MKKQTKKKKMTKASTNSPGWTRFMDMHSGGKIKEDPYQYIYIEATEEEARIIFYNKFGHSPDRVTCTCCGKDYSISYDKSFAQLTGYDRGCATLEVPKDPKTGLYKIDDPIIKEGLYIEKGEKPPKGYKISTKFKVQYQTVEQYKKNKEVLIIESKDIKPEWRNGSVPKQGYVWVD